MYQDQAKLHQARSNVKHDLEEAIILVEQNETRRYAGLVLEGTRSLCGHVCHNTQILNVVACLETEDPHRDWKFLKALDHETVNLLTHMHFLHLSRGLGNFRRFKEFQEAVCQVERKGLFNKLQDLASGNKYALHDIYGPGFQIYLAGSVAYVAQCIPVEARLYDPVNCTQQIPAEIRSEEHGNVTQKYANAQTMILQDFLTKVPCTWQYPPKWKIEDRWYCSFPTVQDCNKAPMQLNLTYDHTFRSMKAIFDGIKGGILTTTQLQGSRLWRQLAQCQEAVAHALAYTALYNSLNQVTLGKPLDQTTTQKIAYVSAMMTTPFFALFGWTWFYLSALMGLFTITNYIFSVTLRMIVLWKEKGFGWWLLGGLWGATYNLLLLPMTVVKNIMVFNREQAEKALPTQGGMELGKTNQVVVQPLQGGTGSNPNETKRPNKEGTYKANDSPYYSVDRQLGQAKKTLARQQEEAAYKLEGVHRYYKGLHNKPPETERPSAPAG
jgi:hypothetical protein